MNNDEQNPRSGFRHSATTKFFDDFAKLVIQAEEGDVAEAFKRCSIEIAPRIIINKNNVETYWYIIWVLDGEISVCWFLSSDYELCKCFLRTTENGNWVRDDRN